MVEKQIRMNIIDRFISYFNPRQGYDRLAWRQALRGYDAGGFDRINSSWNPVNGTAEQINQAQRGVLRARARDLERNSDIAEALVSPFERNVVGTGIKLQSKILTNNKIEDDNLNTLIETEFEEWSKPQNCDITKQQSFSELQALTIRRLMVDGGIIFIKNYIKDKNRNYSFVLQAREVDDLDSSYYQCRLKNGNKVVNGIELNSYNEPIAYYLKIRTVDGFENGKSERIPADRVIFLYKKTRPTQVREVSNLAIAAERVRDVNEFNEAVSVKERILACFSIFIKKHTPTALTPGYRSQNKDSQSGYTQKNIAPGMITELHPGDSVEVANPQGQSSNAKEFIQTQQRLAGAGQGLSYESVSRDMSQVNYSSARQGLLEDQKTYKMWQKFIIEHFNIPVYETFMESLYLSGKLKVNDFFNNKQKYLRHVWIPPGWSWIDPMKEITANQRALESNQVTLAQLCAERGEDWRDVLVQRAKEKELEEKLLAKLNMEAS